MPKLSKFAKMPPEITKAISDLRKAGATVDEIQAHLRSLNINVARSTTAKYIAAEIDEVGQEMRRSNAIADALMPHFGEQKDNKLLALTSQLLKSGLFKILRARMLPNAAAPDPEEMQVVAKALHYVQRAEADDAAVKFKLREVFKKEAAAAVDKVAKTKGLTSDTVDAIKAEILGIKGPAATSTTEGQP